MNNFRFNVWRIYLGVFKSTDSFQEIQATLKKTRDYYNSEVEKYKPLKNAPKDPKIFNPLSRN